MPTTNATPPPGGAPDPRLVALATRCRAVRVALDRLDDQLDLLDKPEHRRLAPWAVAIRDSVDGLEADIDDLAARR